MDIIRICIMLILPPVGVLLRTGINAHFLINIVLTLLGYIPGLVHAIWVSERAAAGEIKHANAEAISQWHHSSSYR